MDNANNMKFNFIKQTLTFVIIGVFIPGFTAVVLLWLQVLLSMVGIPCPTAWTTIWIVTTIGGVTLPILFYRHITRLTLESFRNLKVRLALFNLLEYTLIQSSLMPLFTDENTFCYGCDGQTGLETVFTAWMALPCLIILSIIFNRVFKSVDVNTQKRP